TLTILAALVLLCPASHAAQRSGTAAREAFYRCKDASGQTHYGDSLPQPCRGLDTEVLNENGITVRLIEGERSRTARQAREATETALRQERDARLQRDRTLVETYLSVEDIERLRDQRL